MKNKKQTPQTQDMGRRTLYGETMKQTAIFLPKHMLDWLKSQPGTMSETVRDLVDEAMRRNGETLG